MIRRGTDNNPFAAVIGLLMLALLFIGLFMLARFIFRILALLSPALLIAALILDYKVVLGYGKWVIGLVKQNPLMGIAAILLTIFGFPLVSAFLAGKALLSRNARKARKAGEDNSLEGEFIDFEEVEDEPLTLPELSKVRREEPTPREEQQAREEPDGKKKTEEKGSTYDDLFD